MSTARCDPSPTLIRSRKPCSISTTVCSTAPPSKRRAAPDREAGQPGGDGGDLLGPLVGDAGARGHQQPVGGHQDRVRGGGHLVDELADDPVEPSLVAGVCGRGSRSCGAFLGARVLGTGSSTAAVRPRDTPAACAASRARIASGSRTTVAAAGRDAAGDEPLARAAHRQAGLADLQGRRLGDPLGGLPAGLHLGGRPGAARPPSALNQFDRSEPEDRRLVLGRLRHGLRESRVS